MRFLFYPSLFVLFLLSGCTTPYSGNDVARHDKLLLKELSRSSKKGYDFYTRKRIEHHFVAAQSLDAARVDWMLELADPAYFPEIHQAFRRMQTRQQLISPALEMWPIDHAAISAQFRSDLDNLEYEYRLKSADFLYEQSVRLIALSDSGDHRLARKAADKLQYLHQNNFKSWKNSQAYYQRAKESGVTYFWFVPPQFPVLYRHELQRPLLKEIATLNDDWHIVDTIPLEIARPAYKITFDLVNFYISPESKTETSYTETTQIEVVESTAYDTCGRLVEKKCKQTVCATVTEGSYSKSSGLCLRMLVKDLRNDGVLLDKLIDVKENYVQTWVNVSGDSRATSKTSCGFSMSHSPSDRSMAEKLGDKFAAEFRYLCQKKLLLL